MSLNHTRLQALLKKELSFCLDFKKLRIYVNGKTPFPMVRRCFEYAFRRNN